MICSGPLLPSPFNESCSQNSLFCSAPRLPLAVGTFKCRGDDVKQAVLWALQCGYRHIGTIPPFSSSAHSTSGEHSRHNVNRMRLCILCCRGRSPLNFPWRVVMADTASIYRNEADIGEGIRASGVPREDLFITSKASPSEHG